MFCYTSFSSRIPPPPPPSSLEIIYKSPLMVPRCITIIIIILLISSSTQNKNFCKGQFQFSLSPADVTAEMDGVFFQVQCAVSVQTRKKRRRGRQAPAQQALLPLLPLLLLLCRYFRAVEARSTRSSQSVSQCQPQLVERRAVSSAVLLLLLFAMAKTFSAHRRKANGKTQTNCWSSDARRC